MNAIFLLKTYFRREIVVEKYDRPTCLITPLKWSKTILQKTKGDVMFIGKVEEGIVLMTRNNGVKQRLIMGAIKDIQAHVHDLFITHLLCMYRIC